MKILCAGLSKTGTTSLHQALIILGYQSLHYDAKRLNDIVAGAVANPDFRRYDDIDAVSDIPSAYFFRELLDAYPDAKVILTVRDIESWWTSIRRHIEQRPIIESGWRESVASLWRRDRFRRRNEADAFRRRVRTIVYGSPVPEEFLYKKRFRDHNAAVCSEVPGGQLLVMDVTLDHQWEKLCEFLGLPRPDVPFPHANVTR